MMYNIFTIHRIKLVDHKKEHSVNKMLRTFNKINEQFEMNK